MMMYNNILENILLSFKFPSGIEVFKVHDTKMFPLYDAGTGSYSTKILVILIKSGGAERFIPHYCIKFTVKELGTNNIVNIIQKLEDSVNRFVSLIEKNEAPLVDMDGGLFNVEFE